MHSEKECRHTRGSTVPCAFVFSCPAVTAKAIKTHHRLSCYPAGWSRQHAQGNGTGSAPIDAASAPSAFGSSHRRRQSRSRSRPRFHVVVKMPLWWACWIAWQTSINSIKLRFGQQVIAVISAPSFTAGLACCASVRAPATGSKDTRNQADVRTVEGLRPCGPPSGRSTARSPSWSYTSGKRCWAWRDTSASACWLIHRPNQVFRLDLARLVLFCAQGRSERQRRRPAQKHVLPVHKSGNRRLRHACLVR